MSSGKHSGSPSCRGDRSRAAAQQGGREPSEAPAEPRSEPEELWRLYQLGSLSASVDPWADSGEHRCWEGVGTRGSRRVPRCWSVSAFSLSVFPSCLPSGCGLEGEGGLAGEVEALEMRDGAGFDVLSFFFLNHFIFGHTVYHEES